MGKAKKKSGQGISWLSEIKRNEVIYGHVSQFLPELYPHLRDIILKSNNDSTFEPQMTSLAFKNRLLKCGAGHPFGDEISGFNLHASYLEEQRDCIPRLDISYKKPARWITTKEQLTSLVLHLKSVRHIFIDLENHSWRSYRGITALMQLSDGINVYLVDTLRLHGLMKEFEELFTNPAVIKVFHASQNDIKWLEKDLSLYIVGLMDTQVMHHALYSSNNISYKDLVHESFPFAGMDKAVRNTDFRNRPLHPDQEKYAVLDVYYLSSLYFKLLSKMDHLKLSQVVRDCRKISLLRYTFPILLVEKPTYSPTLKRLLVARDIAARKEDVNPEFICSVSALEKLILKKEVPSGITTSPQIHQKFFVYKDAITAALRGQDPRTIFETEYRDLGIPFPYRPLMFCFNCEATDHVKRNCPKPKSVGKEKKRLHYLANPDKKKKETKRRNAKVKLNPVAKMKRNIRNNRRKQKKRLADVLM